MLSPDAGTPRPLLRRFAVVNLWPDIQNAELENIARIRLAAKNIGVECVVIDKEGRLLDPPGGEISKGDVDFVIHLHFAEPKAYDAFSFVALWNPIQFYYDWGYRRNSLNLMSHDDFLSCESAWADDHVRRMCQGDASRSAETFLKLFHSCPGPVQPPHLGDRKILYSGINWERLLGKPGRFDGLFRLLDKDGILRIHGPDVFQGIRVWKGFKSYAGPIPFDGHSMVEAIRRAGLVLTFSSDAHKQSELMSNRLFEALAAGALPICDENPFARRHFGDTLLYVDSTLPAPELREKLLEHHRWVTAHPDRALEMVGRAQEILKGKFVLDKCLKDIYEEFPRRRARLEALRTPKDRSNPVSLIALCSSADADDVRRHARSVLCQDYDNLEVVLVFEQEAYAQNKEALESSAGPLKAKLGPRCREVFSRDKVGSDGAPAVTRGAVVDQLVASLPDGALFCVVSPEERILSDHVSSLVRALEDAPESPFALSDAVIADSGKKDYKYVYDLNIEASLAGMNGMARFLFRKTPAMRDCSPALRYVNHRLALVLAGARGAAPAVGTRRATVIQDILHPAHASRIMDLMEKEIIQDFLQDFRLPSEVVSPADVIDTLSNASDLVRLSFLKSMVKAVPLPKRIFRPLRSVYRLIKSAAVRKAGDKKP